MNPFNPKKTRPAQPGTQLEKDPDDWVTGNAPMTAAQAAYLQRLCERAGEAFSAHLTKARAAKRIHALRKHPGYAPRRHSA